MRCPGRRENPPAWLIEDANGSVKSYVIQNPLGECHSRWVILPLHEQNIDFAVLSYSRNKPKGALRIKCPLQNDEAYSEVATACIVSSVSLGYYPDTSGPLLIPSEDDEDDE